MGGSRRGLRVELLVGAYALIASIAIVLPALVYVEHRLETFLLEDQIDELAEDEATLVDGTSRRLATAERSAARFAHRISSIPVAADPGARAEFDRLVERNPDGAYRSRRSAYDARTHAGIWIPRHGRIDDGIAAFYLRAKTITEEAMSTVDEPLFVNAWVLPISVGEVIAWPDAPDFIYLASAEHDYVDSDWVGLARPDRNPTGEPRWTRVEFDPVPRVWMVSVVAPFFRDGTFAGSVGHDVPLDRLIGTAPVRARRPDASFLVLDDEGRLLASTHHGAAIESATGQLRLGDFPDRTLRPVLERLFRNSRSARGVRREETDTHVVLGTRVEATNWLIVSAIPRASIGRRIEGPLMMMRVATFVALALVLVASLVTIVEDRRRKREADEALRASEAKLVQAQKMDAVGRLAGGIAHDFNNIITAISAFAQLAERRVPKTDASLKEHLVQIQRAASRATDLTRQLLAFARKQPIRPRVVDLNLIVKDLHKLLRRLIGEDIELVTLTATEQACALIDPGQLEQVLTNLAVNARDAMPHGGKLAIRVATTPNEVVLRVEDDGMGMTEDVRRRIFEPFFTTKEVGRGTGLGLSTCFAIIQQAKGHIEVESAVGEGTTFIIGLPRSAEAPADVAEAKSPTGPVVSSGRVLVVEDDPQVRRVVITVLANHGFEVVEASNGAVAIAAIERLRGRVDCVVTDVVMPVAGGGDLVRSLRREYPRIPVVVMSGYVDDSHLLGDVATSHVDFLSKPFTPDELIERVSASVTRGLRHPRLEVIDGERGS